MYADNFSGRMDGLPDPDRDAQFYDGVPSRRLAAWFVDFVIVLVLGVPVAFVFGLMTLGFGFVAFPLILSLVGFAYRIVTLSGKSSTWGMRFMGIEFRRQDGSRFDTITALIHTAIYTVSVSVVVLQVISCVLILTTRYNQSLSDLILRTAAINRPAD